ncbi:MAG: ribulokinase [Roseiflexaceae bacterium]|nr:ribulokinase [Roseiflexaceae bacterium]
MGERKYVIGVDFGTESGRALLVEVANGYEVASAVSEYSNGVIDERLPGTDIRLDPDWALQDPNDYVEVFKQAVPAVLAASKIDPADVVGIGIDFTSCTMLPTTPDGTPLCFLPEWRTAPHAWVKLWKHHAAQPEATRMTTIAAQTDATLLPRYGGKISSEWLFPKAWQILNEAPAVYAAAGRVLEAGDWVVWQLTGQEARSAGLAGYKALWSKQHGFPPNSFFRALDPRLEQIVDEKMTRRLHPLGGRAGGLSEQAARWMGLKPGTAVAVANVDAHVSVPPATVVEPGRMVIILGTSNCHMLMTAEERLVPGICGVVEDGIVPGLWGYEAGQPCVGDGFSWFVKQGVPAALSGEAAARGISVYQLLEERAALLKPGESGLLALDWWNGSRSVLVDGELSSLLLGATLATKPEEIYRAYIEATAYGTRLIIDTFEAHGVPIHEIVVTGGLPDRNALLMQIYADVTGRTLRIARSRQGGALGAAMYGAVAAGVRSGGHASIADASRAMGDLRDDAYGPIPAHQHVYDQLYAEYVILHDYFGRGANDVMKRLKNLREASRAS